jgi:hypothetical protein
MLNIYTKVRNNNNFIFIKYCNTFIIFQICIYVKYKRFKIETLDKALS